MRKQVRRRLDLRSDRGQSLWLFAILLPLLLGFTAIVIDGGHGFAEKRRVQNAADASALAAARDIGPALSCADTACRELQRSTIKARAEQYSLLNGGSGTLVECDAGHTDNCYTWPYNGSWARVEVKLRNQVDGFFTNVLGLGSSFFKPAARAVASAAQVDEAHCRFDLNGDGIDDNEDADPDNDIENPDQYLNTTPPCTIPPHPLPGTYEAATADQCRFDVNGDGVDDNEDADPGNDYDPYQYANTTPPCTGPTTGGLEGAVALVMSRECDAISYTGAGDGKVGTLVTNGGVWFNGSAPKRIDKLGYDQPGCPDHPARPPSGRPACSDPGQANGLLCARQLIDLSESMPLNWPVPPPAEPTPVPLVSWNATSDYPSKCIDLGTRDRTFAPGEGPPGIYCLTGGATLTLTADFTTGDGYTFFALDGGRINVAGAIVKFYWPSACNSEYGFPLTDGRPTTRPTSFTCFGRTIPGYDPQTLFYATNAIHSKSTDPCERSAICINGGGAKVTGDMFAVAPAVFPPPDRSPRP